MTTMITLITSFYYDPDRRRRAELLECLWRNAANPRLAGVHLFIEDATPAEQSELALSTVHLVAHGRRVTYQDLFAYAGRYLAGDTVIVANADIYFDESLALLDGYDLQDRLLCLSRWDVHPDGSAALFNHPSSQDAWIFKAPLRSFPCDFHLGILGCDNRLAWEAANAGLLLSNPSVSLRACHLHLSQVRRYNPRRWLDGPTLSVPATRLDPLPGHPMEIEGRGGLLPDYPVPAQLSGRQTDSEESRMPTPPRPIFALTSLSPAVHSVAATRACIASWRAAGLHVRAFNHPDEILILAALYDVEFVPVSETSTATFGRHFVPITAMLNWAAVQDATVLLINADIELRLAPWELTRLRWLADGGLCYFVRYNHDGNFANAQREPAGIDAFMLHGRHATLFAASFMSMGQPFWDYWLPHTIAACGYPIFSIEFPAGFHRNHPLNWSWESWHRCAIEFARVTGETPGDGSFEACVEMSLRVRRAFDRGKRALSQRPPEVRAWVQQTFRDPGPKLFLELGAHRGTDTSWLAQISGVRLHAFEPDPRNHPPPQPNLTMHRAAIADRDGRGQLILSAHGWGQEWTHSSSIKRPKNHLRRYPVSFGDAVEVDLVTLDSFYHQHEISLIDFIWAAIQGAEGEMARGGQLALRNTRYLYTEYSDDELYDGQVTLAELLSLLPDFRVVELWEDDVLLKNQRLP